MKKDSTITISKSTLLSLDVCDDMVVLAISEDYDLRHVSFHFSEYETITEGDGAQLRVTAKFTVCNFATPDIADKFENLKFTASFALIKWHKGWAVVHTLPIILVCENEHGQEQTCEFMVSGGNNDLALTSPPINWNQFIT